jgi:hypothetical protein
MLDGSYSGLLASIADWLNRQDIAATIPDFVALAEADISRRLVLAGAPREMTNRAATVIDNEFELTPPDFMGAIALYVEGSRKPLEFIQPEKITERKELYPDACGNPTAYAIVGPEFQFWPAPQAAMQLDLIYIRRVQSLNNSINSNWLLNLHPDCYLYGSLVQSAPYLKDDNRIQVWQSKYDQILSSISMAGQRAQAAPHLAMPIKQNIV